MFNANVGADDNSGAKRKKGISRECKYPLTCDDQVRGVGLPRDLSPFSASPLIFAHSANMESGISSVGFAH